MGLLKLLFGSSDESRAEKSEKQRERDFDVLKYDGVRALKVGEVAYAIRCFQEAITLRRDPETMSFLAESLMTDGQAEAARKLWDELAAELPEHIEVRLGMIHADEVLHDYERMDKDCQAALQLAPNNTSVLYRSAQAKHALHDDLNAVALLTRVLMQDENMEDALLLRAEVLREMGSPKEAEKDIDRLLEQPEPAEEALMQKAGLRLQQGDAEKAIDYYNKVIEQNPMRGEAYVALSTAYSAHRQLDRALATMNEAAELLPDCSEVYKERGRIKLLLNYKAGAADDLKKSLDKSPESSQTVSGKFTNIEQEMEAQYKSRNPYGF
ncbi:MAG: tetratricopeptide repeat protein [Paraprevotella sp.]|nr:tetratricopeptide repeat protein [Paraprevotella sp.]